MMTTLTNNIFKSIYFLVKELNKIDKYSNLIEMNYNRNLIQNIITDKTYLLNENKLLKESINTYFPLIRQTSVHLNNQSSSEETPEFILYFLSGFNFNNSSQKTIEFLKECKPTLFINVPLFQYFITNASYNGAMIFFEDTINLNFNDVHSIVDENFTIIDDNKRKELRLIYLQNNIIKELSKFFKIIFKEQLYYKQQFFNINHFYNIDNLLLITYPGILANNIEYKIPKIFEKLTKYSNIGLYDLLVFANLKIYFEMKFNLNLQNKSHKELLDKVIMQLILSYYLHPHITNKYFNKESNFIEQYEKEKEYCLEFITCLNDIINMWMSNDFQETSMEYQYYYAFRPYEINYE